LLGQKYFLDTRQHSTSLRTVVSRANPQIYVWLGDTQLVEKHRRHIGVIVLPSIHQHLNVPFSQLTAHRSGFDELGPHPTTETTFTLTFLQFPAQLPLSPSEQSPPR